MKSLLRNALCFILLLSGTASLLAEQRYLLRVPSDDLQFVLDSHGLEFVGAIDDPSGELFLVEGPDTVAMALVEGDDAVIAIEAVGEIVLPEIEDGVYGTSIDPLVAALADRTLVDFFGDPAWVGYINQEAVSLIDGDKALAEATGQGVVVAVIDTGVDPQHHLLDDSLVEGYDFLRNEPGYASEWLELPPGPSGELQASVAWSLVDVEPMQLNQSVAWILEQSVAWILEGYDLPGAFGHGTMVSGIVHLVAPEASIMPLKAFTSEGVAQTVDIVRAIYFAVDNGADVINMSFSTSSFSEETLRALNHAMRSGVVCIASAGNSGEQVLVYPAAHGSTIGVGSTSNLDERSLFSNYGDDLVTLAAPGEGVVTTFPGGGAYAAGWGTSFSGPLVAGTTALQIELIGTEGSPESRLYRVLDGLAEAEPLAPGSGLGYGRMNTEQAVDKLGDEQ